MLIERNQLNVGAYYVLRVDMRDGAAQIVQYLKDFTKALEYANHNFDATIGYKFIVVEVQGSIQAQGTPSIVTSLTRKL